MYPAIILAGGLGSRLRPLTDTMPKPLLPVNDKPILEHIIDNLRRHNVRDIIISIGYKAEMVQEYFGNGDRFGQINITYSIEQELLGTGGAVNQASKGIDGPFILIWGDNLMDIDVTRMKKEYIDATTDDVIDMLAMKGLNNNAHISTMIMALTERHDVEHFGVADLDNNKIINFIEKPRREDAPSNLINAGAFIMDPSCLSVLPSGKSSIERECFAHLAPLRKIKAFTHVGQWYPTDTLEKYLIASKYL